MKKQLTISAQIDHTSKETYIVSVKKLARTAIFGSNVNPAVPLRMKGLLNKKEFEITKAWYELIAKREAKRISKLYPFCGVAKVA